MLGKATKQPTPVSNASISLDMYMIYLSIDIYLYIAEASVDGWRSDQTISPRLSIRLYIYRW